MSIKSQYYNPKLSGSFSGVSGFFKNRKFKDLSKVKQEISKLETYALHKPVKLKHPSRAITVHFANYQLVGDLIDYQLFSKENDGYRYILLVIDAFTRYVSALPIKQKTGKEMVYALKKIYKERGEKRPAPYLQFDQGKEVFNKEVQAYLKSINVTLFNTWSDKKAALAERAIRTLKTRLERYFTYTRRHRYVHVLQSFINSMNSSYHSSIKMSPKEARNPKMHETIWNNLYEYLLHIKKPKDKFKVGDRVRISRYKAIVGRKGYKQNFSNEIFVIKKVIDSLPVTTYQLKDLNNEEITGNFYSEELQLVEEDG